jgi:hypothetical protein
LEEKEVTEKNNSEKYQILLISLTALVIFFLVYSPHFGYRFPYHVDEWHHISEAIKLGQGEYTGGTVGYRVGFHVLLLILSSVFNLVTVYKFLPAMWAVISALVLFFVVYRKTNKFLIALFSMIFFGSIKSNVNLLGLWFFTPLSFSIPFIFLYVYFFTEGIEKQNKKYILVSLAIMAFVLFVHPVSVLFAAPFLLIYSFIHLDYIKREYKFFSSFLIIPILGILFYSFMRKMPLSRVIQTLIGELQFRYGWGVAEVSNAFTELYSVIGYILAIIGIVMLFILNKNMKKHLIYVLWPASLLVLITIFRLTGVSYLSPYQRNLYYFVISLPILSAFGLYLLLELLKKHQLKLSYKKIISVSLIIVVLILAFKSYYSIPENLLLYKVIEDKDYDALLFLSKFESSRVIAKSYISTAMYPVSGHKPVATFYFHGNREDTEKFFDSDDCETKQELLDKHDVKYVLSGEEIDCGWSLIYDKDNFIYKID